MVWLLLLIAGVGGFVVGALWENGRRGGSADLADELDRVHDGRARAGR